MTFQRDIITDYLTAIARYPLLTRSQEIELAIAIKSGNRAAKNRLIQCNLRLVVSIVKPYLRVANTLDFEDLVQEGGLGLIRAAEKFDHTLGCKFSTYASWWIKQGITRAISNKSRVIRLPINAIERRSQILQSIRSYKIETGKAPTLSQIAFLTKLSAPQVRESLNIRQSSSLDQPLLTTKDGRTTLGDLQTDKELTPLDRAIEVERIEQVWRLLQELPTRDRRVIEMRFGLIDGEVRDLPAIADEFGCSSLQIRLLLAAIKRRLEKINRTCAIVEKL